MTRQTGAMLVSALVLSALAPMAYAQTSGGAAEAPLVPPGPPIAGVCVLLQQGLITDSTVGKFVINRINQLTQQANAEINGQVSTLQNDGKAFESARASYTQDQLQQKAAQLQQRDRDIQQLAQQRNQELQATKQKAYGRILTESLPFVRQQVQERNCSLVLDGSSVLAVNPGMDLTPSVVQSLNGKITQFEFDREHLDAGAAGGR